MHLINAKLLLQQQVQNLYKRRFTALQPREMCPNELDFTTAVEKAKESLRKARQRHNENVGLQREKGQVSKSASSNGR